MAEDRNSTLARSKAGKPISPEVLASFLIKNQNKVAGNYQVAMHIARAKKGKIIISNSDIWAMCNNQNMPLGLMGHDYR